MVIRHDLLLCRYGKRYSQSGKKYGE